MNEIVLRAAREDIFAQRVQEVQRLCVDPRGLDARRLVELEAEDVLCLVTKQRLSRLLLAGSLLESAHSRVLLDLLLKKQGPIEHADVALRQWLRGLGRRARRSGRDLLGMRDARDALGNLLDLHYNDLLLHILALFIYLALENVSGLGLLVVTKTRVQSAQLLVQVLPRVFEQSFKLSDLARYRRLFHLPFSVGHSFGLIQQTEAAFFQCLRFGCAV